MRQKPKNYIYENSRKLFDNSDSVPYTYIKTYVRTPCDERGIQFMTENEQELIRIIRENDNPAEALMTAAVIVLGFLKQHESSEEQVAVCLPALS